MARLEVSCNLHNAVSRNTCLSTQTPGANRSNRTLIFATNCATGPPKPLSRTPAWLKRPVSGVLGFGGKLAVLTHARESDQPNAPLKLPYEAHVEVKQVSSICDHHMYFWRQAVSAATLRHGRCGCTSRSCNMKVSSTPILVGCEPPLVYTVHCVHEFW